jgi:hypothetical protein
MTIFVLSNESGIIKATAAIDEATIWKAQGGTYKEVLFSEGTELVGKQEDDCVEIYNDDDEHIASTKQCKQTNLWMIGNEYIEDLPLTDYLAYDIEHETRAIPEKEPCNEDMEFDAKRDYERMHKYL